MGDRFFNAEHSRMKLNGTICLYKGTPYYIRHVGESEVVSCSPMDGTARDFPVAYTDPEFDYTHIPLGYMTTEDGQALYLAREPQRIHQQGLLYRALRTMGSMTCTQNQLEGYVFRKQFVDCVLGKHVTFKEAMERLQGGAKGVSISRHMAVIRQSSRLYVIEYRGRTIAVSQNKGETFKAIEHEGAHLIMKRLQNNGVSV